MVHDGLALYVNGDERGDIGREGQGGEAGRGADAETDGGFGGGGGGGNGGGGGGGCSVFGCGGFGRNRKDIAGPLGLSPIC